MIKVFIEAEAGSRNKNRYDKKTLVYKETGEVAQPYPYPYGFILGTRGPDDDSVDCYILTKDALKAGTMVECEPIGLLEQHEGEEIDHKVLATLSGQEIELDSELHKKLSDFIHALFAEFPELNVRVGRILPREAALIHIQNFRDG
jgi:inorganic pyrophosphatase